LKRYLGFITVCVLLISCAKQEARIENGTLYDTNSFSRQVPSDSLFNNHASEPQGTIAMTSQNKAYVVGSGGSNNGGYSGGTYTGGSYIPGGGYSGPSGYVPGGQGCNPFYGCQMPMNPIDQFISLSNQIFQSYPQVLTIGWIYFGDQPVYANGPAQPWANDGPYSAGNVCMEYTMTLTETSGNSLARIRLGWNGQGDQPIFQRSGPNNNTITLKYQLVGSGTGDFMFAIEQPQQGYAQPMWGNGSNESLKLSVRQAPCADQPQYIAPDTAACGNFDLTQYLDQSFQPIVQPYLQDQNNVYSQMGWFTQSVGMSAVKARFISNTGQSPLWQQQYPGWGYASSSLWNVQ
jgi:hypothetical protein